jgi:quinoprotein glucose dehydrogenase
MKAAITFYTKKTVISLTTLAIVWSCVRLAQNNSQSSTITDTGAVAQRAAERKAKTALKLAEGLQVSLWASDSLAPDPVSMDIDKHGAVYITRTNRQKNSEFDIRGYRHWMTESIGLQTVEDRRAFLHKTFAPEKSTQNQFLHDLNQDGSHDWHDLAVEKDEIWKLEDKDHDGFADTARQIFSDFNEEITDVAGGLLVLGKDIFYAIAPDLWRLTDTNADGLPDHKTSISHGYGVHIGFSGHGMSGVIQGPDGRIYWNIGDIGANITAPNGSQHPNPNSGIIARANPDGSDFEIYATGLRNTHEFVFDQYGNLISSDNDGDHPGESERLVHVVQGSDAGWRSNWQYGKYTDPLNNNYKVWMDEKLYLPRHSGQAAYIIPPIQNYHNGPTGMVYNPGTALGQAWQNKFFLVEFVGAPARSGIWSFGLKPKGASFELASEQLMISGILPTGIRFGPDGALYAADWVNGWDTKNYGRVWKIDVAETDQSLKTQRAETQSLMLLNYAKAPLTQLETLLAHADMRIRQNAQFELAARGESGNTVLQKTATSNSNQLARIHAIWGIGQLARQNKSYGNYLGTFLTDADPEIIAQTAKILGDSKIQVFENELIKLLSSTEPRIQFFAAEALGKLQSKAAIPALIQLIERNNDSDVYIRHAAVLALTKIGDITPIVALKNSSSEALRTAAVLVLRRLQNPNITQFLLDPSEYIATEAARGINDDLSIPIALPALASMLEQTKFNSEPLIRRAINAALRVGSKKALEQLISYAKRSSNPPSLKAEAWAAISTWPSPSLTDRVDGRYRGPIVRNSLLLKNMITPELDMLLADTNTQTVVAAINMIGSLGIQQYAPNLANMYQNTSSEAIKIATLTQLNTLKYSNINTLIKVAMADNTEVVRSAAIGMLTNQNTTAESLTVMVNNIMTKGGPKEKQQIINVLGKLSPDRSSNILAQLLQDYAAKKLPNNINLELFEAVEANGSAALLTQLSQTKPQGTELDQYSESLYGGSLATGRNIFNSNSAAQCVRCHAVGQVGGTVGPELSQIAQSLTREQLLEALVSPSARLSPGFGNVDLTLTTGQEVSGVLLSETPNELTLKTSDAEPLVVEKLRIKKRENLPSAMPAMGSILSKRELRDVVEYLQSLK